MDARTAVMKMTIVLPGEHNGDIFEPAEELDVEYDSHPFVESCSVHVNGGTDRQGEPGYFFGYVEFVGGALNGDGERGCG